MFEEDNDRKYTYQYLMSMGLLTSDHLPPESGYDEGYCYAWCDHCDTETEHDDGFCFSCKK